MCIYILTHILAGKAIKHVLCVYYYDDVHLEIYIP